MLWKRIKWENVPNNCILTFLFIWDFFPHFVVLDIEPRAPVYAKLVLVLWAIPQLLFCLSLHSASAERCCVESKRRSCSSGTCCIPPFSALRSRHNHRISFWGLWKSRADRHSHIPEENMWRCCFPCVSVEREGDAFGLLWNMLSNARIFAYLQWSLL